MAWGADTSFETTNGSTTPTDGNDVAGTGDGTGWTGNWTEGSASTGYHNYDNGVSGIPDGSWTCECDTGTSNLEPRIYRNLSSAVTAGRVSVRFRCNKVNRDIHYLMLYSGSTRVASMLASQVSAPTSRPLGAHDGGSWPTLATGMFAKDTWYQWEIDFDCSTDTYDVYVDGVKKNTSSLSFENSVSTIDRIHVQNGAASASGSSAGSIHYWDMIENGDAGGPAGTNIQMNIGDTWKVVDGMQINIGDTWKTVAGAQQNIGDVWKTIF